MQTRILKVRDSGDIIPVLAIKTEPETEIERDILATHCEYEDDNVLLVVLDEVAVSYHPFAWPRLGIHPRSLPLAHSHIIRHFDELRNGEEIDVENLTGNPIDPEELRPTHTKKRDGA